MKKKIMAFTLIEILLVISIIGMMTLGVSRLYMNVNSDKQNLNIFTVKFSSIIDTVKNYSLVGKGIGNNLVTPDSYTIRISTGGYITTYYNTGTSDIVFNELTIPSFDLNYKVNFITCRTITYTSPSKKSVIDIIFKGSDITLSGCTNFTTQKVVDFNIMYKGFSKNLRFNSVSGVLKEL
ncbi:MAG: type II secretion system protein [Candidatus Gracilibacteria bacterium]|nr:type II secretion system protein [Candidatus Gracilibacteria bacterium]